MLHPHLVVQIPVDGLHDAHLKAGLRVPAQVSLDLAGVDAVAPVMAQAVLHVLDEALVDLRVVQAIRELGDDGLHDEDVWPLVVSAHIVHLAALAALRHHVDGLAVILHKEPVPDLHAVAVDGKLLVVLGVVDHQGDQLLRELPHAVVVAAAGDVHRHAVGIVEGFHEVISGGLGRGIGRMGVDGRGFGEETGGAQGAVDLVGADLDKLLSLLPGLLPGVVPGVLGPLQEVHRAHHIGGHEDLGVCDGAVHMGLRRKVDDEIRVILPDERGHKLLVADIAVDKDVPLVVLDVLQVLQIAGIGQGIQVDDANVRILFQHIVDKGGSDKPGAAGNEISGHW